MPSPDEIEWDESTTKAIYPDDVEWDESTTVSLEPAFDGATADASGETRAAPVPLAHAALAALTGNVIPARAPVGNRPPMENPGPQAALAQGMTRNYLDEIVGANAQVQSDMLHLAGDAPGDPTQQVYQTARDEVRKINQQYANESPWSSFGLNVLGGAATSPLQGTAGIVGEGMAAGVGASKELNADTPRDAMVGGLLSFAGKQAGDILGEVFSRFLSRGSQAAGDKVAQAQTKAREMAAEKVAAEIASAKGKLGATTQEANRAVENLLRLESTGALTGEQSTILTSLRENGVLPALERKLAASMLDQVPDAAGRIDAARSAMQELAERAPQATDEGARAILSGQEARRQVGERLKRYLPTAVGAAYGAAPGAAAGLVLGGGAGDALVGGLAGAALRPAIRAGLRMAAHPSVQSAVYTPLRNLAATGAAVAPGVASAVGAAAGRAASAPPSGDGDLAQALALQNPEALGPYAEQLQSAAASGRLPLVHWHLQQTDPQYRMLLEEARKGGEQ